MERYKIGLITTLLLGIFIVIGALIALLANKKSKVVEFSIGLAFGVIVTLIVTDLLPEIFETLGFRYIYVWLIGMVAGFLILKILDNFIPDHHEHKMSKEESNENLVHIGVMTSLALVLHNIIEGMAVYSSCLSDASFGIALTLGIGFHNIPLGMVISSSFYHSTKNFKKTIITVLIVSLSTFFGGFVMYLLKLTEISSMLLGVLLSLTLGMLIFIIIDELLPRISDIKNKKISCIGILVGVALLVLSMFI
ncbi:MAG: ZIP family metal transporter [Bacilli bacterium]|nr:ZIP family metal transporter [Bacilli bacterium]